MPVDGEQEARSLALCNLNKKNIPLSNSFLPSTFPSANNSNMVHPYESMAPERQVAETSASQFTQQSQEMYPTLDPKKMMETQNAMPKMSSGRTTPPLGHPNLQQQQQQQQQVTSTTGLQEPFLHQTTQLQPADTSNTISHQSLPEKEPKVPYSPTSPTKRRHHLSFFHRKSPSNSASSSTHSNLSSTVSSPTEPSLNPNSPSSSSKHSWRPTSIFHSKHNSQHKVKQPHPEPPSQHVEATTAFHKTQVEPVSNTPEQTQQDTRQPDTFQPDTSQPDTLQLDTLQLDTLQLDTLQLDNLQPELTPDPPVLPQETPKQPVVKEKSSAMATTTAQPSYRPTTSTEDWNERGTPGLSAIQQDTSKVPAVRENLSAMVITTAQPSYRPPTSTEDWKERGAASLIKTETDANGKVSTRVIKKGVQDFDFGDNLGIGSYSTVVGATDKQTLRTYAIKILDKRHIIKEKKVKYVDIEKNTLNRLGDHPGIIKLYYTFQDEASLYFVLDFAANGELLSLIKKMGSLDEDCTQYYGAQILDAVEYMHSKGVVHRDLKPENILLDDKMRVKITDFGTAKLLANDVDANGNKLATYPKDIRASSFVGTAEYVAPELLAEKAQGKPCDVWAFGCILYQLIAGRPPFKAGNEYQTFQKIVKLQYSYPPGFPPSVRDLLKHILMLDPAARWTIPAIKNHAFFDGIDWDRKALWKKRHPRLQPYRSSIGGVRSASNPVLVKPAFPRSAGSSSTNLNGRKNPANPRSASASNLLTSTASSDKNPYSNGNNSASSTAVKKPNVRASASTAAAAALAKPPSAISPYYTPTQEPLTQRGQTPRVQVTLPPRPQINIRSRTQPALSTNEGSQPSSNMATNRPVPQVKPSQQPKPPTYPPKALESKSNQQGGFAEALVIPMELPMPSSVDQEFSNLISKQERIIRIGTVLMATSSSGSQPEPVNEKEPGKFSKLFLGSRKKKRLLIVTTSGRLLIVAESSERKHVQHDIAISSSQVNIREFPYNRKAGVGVFSVETHNKIHTVEDPSGSGDWIAAFARAREYVANAEAVLASKTHNAAAAAAMAAANAAGGGPRHSSVSGAAGGGQASSLAPSPMVASSASSFERRSSDFDHVPGTASSMLQRNEERKMMRRGLSFNA